MDEQERLKKRIKNLEDLNLSVDAELIDIIADSQGFYKELRDAGFPDETEFPHTTAYINAIKPIPKDFIDIVMKWIPKRKYKGWPVGFLREAKNKYDGRVLIPIFNESNKLGRWSICDAIAYNPPLNINDWVKETYLSKEYGYSETGLLPLAVARMFPKDEARAILKQGFDHHYRVTPEALGKVGTAEDIPFLEKRLQMDYDATHVHKDIEKAIKRIKKRAKLI